MGNPASGAARALAALLLAVAAWRARRRRFARVLRELSSYSDRGLAEMGIARGDIVDVARGRYGI